MALETQTHSVAPLSIVNASDEQSDADMDSIFANWQFLALVAWRGYLSSGCGAVLVSVGDGCADVAYASGALLNSYARFVDAYNPKEQVVVVIRHPNGERVYVLGGWPRPSDCLAADTTPPAYASVYCIPRTAWQQ